MPNREARAARHQPPRARSPAARAANGSRPWHRAGRSRPRLTSHRLSRLDSIAAARIWRGVCVVSSGERVELIDASSQLAPRDLRRVAGQANQLVAKRRLRLACPRATRGGLNRQSHERRRALDQQLEASRAHPEPGGCSYQTAGREHAWYQETAQVAKASRDTFVACQRSQARPVKPAPRRRSRLPRRPPSHRLAPARAARTSRLAGAPEALRAYAANAARFSPALVGRPALRPPECPRAFRSPPPPRTLRDRGRSDRRMRPQTRRSRGQRCRSHPRYAAIATGSPDRAWPPASASPHACAYSASSSADNLSIVTEPFMSRS